MMGFVEEKIRAGGLISGANTSLLEGMKFLKEMQDQSGLFPSVKKSFFFFFFFFFFLVLELLKFPCL
jgi:auxin response factor